MMTLKMLSSVLGATMAASLFATLRITEICPRPDALDPNGKEAGWIELTNTGDEPVNLKDYALIRWNRGKENKEKNRRILCNRVVQPGARTLVYTSEAYPNYWDGEYVAVYDNDVMVFPSKVNPKKFPNVALYRADRTTLLQTLIVPVDLEDNKSFGPGDAYNRIQVVDADSEYTYQVGEGEQQTGAGRLTVSTTQLPSDVTGRVEFSSTQQDELVATLTDYSAAKDDKNILQANAYDFSAMDAGNKGVRVTPTAYPESMYAISFWFRSNPSEVKVNTNTTGNGMPLFESRPSPGPNDSRSGMMLFINDDDQLTLQPRNASGTSTTLATMKTYTDDLWHHVVIISGQKSGEKVTLYVDGIAEIQGELANDCELQSTIPYCFGHAYNSTSWHTYKGQIADIRLFNREVSATEVAQLRDENAASRNVTGTFIETKVSVLDGTVAGYAFENDIKANEMYVATREGCRSLCENGETLAFWIKPSTFTTSFGQEAITLMDSRNGSQDENGYLLLIGTNADTKQRKIYIQRGGKTKVNYEFANQEQLIVNEWTHVTFSIDATTKTATLYINGVKVDAQMMNDYTPATVTHRLGGSYDSYWCGFRGEMSEINIFSGVLPAREVAKLHNASTLATTKVTEAGTDDSADVYESVDTLPSTVTGEMTVTLPKYAEGATLTFSAPETAGQLALAWNSEAIELDAPIALDGATTGTLAWTLTADDGAHRISVLITAELADIIAGETRAIMPNMTPGEANDYTGAIAYGPNIGPSNATKDGGLGYTLSSPMAKEDEPYAITLEVYPIAEDAQNAITKVELIYRSNFGEVKYVDASGSNGKYTGTIPAEDIPANGQLIQFGARITDGAGRQWISPSRNNPDDCPLWYGTIVEPIKGQKSETLQTLHLFVEEEFLEKKYQQKANAEYVGLIDIDYDVAKKTYGKKLGARVGIYDGQTDTYYDNVRIDLRGNTSADFPKKSHGLRFSKCQPLTCVNPLDGSELEEIRKTSFTAEYADPTFIRQSLSFHVWRNAGNKMPFHYPVRLNLNGEFYQLAFHSNRFTDELIEDYYGLDPMGYGYKNVGTISPKVGTTAGSVEKKTPDDGDETSDLAYKPLKDWAETFKQSKDCPENDPTLTNVVYDSFDIPAWINYLATARITQECDDVWANICLYWDKNGNDVWMPLAYDHNLSFGAWYFGDDRNKGRIGLRADDDTFKSHPFYGGWKVRAYNLAGTALNEGNYAVEALWQNEDFRQMYLRRLRTLMDEYLKAPGTAQEETPFWDYVELFKEVTAADAELDRAKWGYPDLKQSGKGEEIYVWDHENWDDPEIDGWDNSLAYDDMWDNYVVPRRKHLYETHSITNTEWETGYAANKNAGIPNAHPTAFAPILMKKVEGGVKLTNPNRDSIDLSGWTVEGMMDVSTLPEDSEDVFTLPPGTVLLGGNSLVLAYDRKKYVEDNDPCFVIGLAVYGDDKTWIPKPNTEATSIVLKKADGEVVLPAEISTWLNEAIANGKVTAEALAEVTAAADYELAYLLDEAPIANMAVATELDIAAFTIDAEGNVTLTATLTVNRKEKLGAITGQIKLYAKESLSDVTWIEVAQEQDFGSKGEAQLTPRATKSSVVPRFFKAKIER